MNHKILGVLGLIGAPFLLLDSINGGFTVNHSSSLSGFLNFVYITGWMCSMLALKRMGAMGEKKFGKTIFVVQMCLLTLANCWNIYEWAQPYAGTRLYFFLDAFWPLSNACMLITGITIAVAGVLSGWHRYVPLVVGCWLPVGMVLWAIFSRTGGMLVAVNIYSAFAWSLMAFVIITSQAGVIKQERTAKPYGKTQLA
jgi:hypothetical protein